jgi:hypothetical protein
LILAKTSAHTDPNYQRLFTTWSSFLQIIAQHATDFWLLIHFQNNKPGNAWLAIFLVLNAVLLPIFSGKKLLHNKLFLLFFGSAVGTYVLVCASNWNAIMDRPLHHFTPAYFFLAMALLVGWQEAKSIWLQRGFPLALGVMHGIAAFWFVATLSLTVPGRISMMQAKRLVGQLEQRAPGQRFGLIGTYWNTYSVDALSKNVISIPCEGELVRTTRYVKQVFSSPEIVLIKTGWRDDLPEQLMQHGHQLQKTSGNFLVDDFEYAFYRVVDAPSAQ